MRLTKSLSKLASAGKILQALTPSLEGSRLSELGGLKQNPGNLNALHYVPETLAAPAPLVVVLHGCTQSAAGYDQGSGWSRLADRHGFALLFPEQTRANNPNLCFNWYTAGNSQRGMGEPASIRAMVEAMCSQYGIDRQRIFVTGLSAGGAMASVMLATYPDLFSGGAIIAGIPYGCASGVAEAFQCMGGRAQADTAELAGHVRRASPHKGPWPRISVWHGSEDRTVMPSNADASVRQWTAIHGLSPEPSRTETVEGYPRRIWAGPDGHAIVEEYEITGMAHGTPLMPGTEAGQSGEAMAHMLDVGLSSTDRIAAFFGIAPEPETATIKRDREPARPPAASSSGPANEVQKVIEDALKAAGLMR